MSDHIMRLQFFDKDSRLIYEHVLSSRQGCEVDVSEFAGMLRGVRVEPVPVASSAELDRQIGDAAEAGDEALLKSLIEKRIGAHKARKLGKE